MAGLVPAIHAGQHQRMRGGWVYIMTNHANGVLYVGAIQRESNLKHWPRAWKIRLILDTNPEWRDLYEDLA
jgi:putative endonuclease